MSAVSSPNGPRTIIVPTDGTGSVSFTLPPGVTLDLQSVFATIDATGAAATTAELTISDQSGVVIAKKRQGEVIPAADTGSATWALRLDGDSAGAASASGPLEHIGGGPLTTCLPGIVTPLAWAHGSGASLLSGLPGLAPTFTVGGTYAVYLEAVRLLGAAGAFTMVTNFAAGIGGTQTGVPGSAAWTVTSPLLFGPTMNLTRAYAASNGLHVELWHDAAGSIDVGLFGTVQKLS